MIAVDVVVLPPAEVADKALEINSTLRGRGNMDILLDRQSCLPHISLAMGCMKDKDIPHVVGVLSGIASSFSPVKLEAVKSSGGRAWIKLAKTRDIELLHEIVMIRLSPYFSYKVTPEMICGSAPAEVHDITLDYIRKFPVSSSFENFTPHITLGTGDMDVEIEPFSFVCGEVAICHLGDFCTCKKVLSSHRLSLKGE